VKAPTLGELLSMAFVVVMLVLIVWYFTSPTVDCITARERVEYYAACETNASCRLDADQARRLARARERLAECSSPPSQENAK